MEKCPQGIAIPAELSKLHDIAVKETFGVDENVINYLKNKVPGSLVVCFGAGLRGRILQNTLLSKGIVTDYFCDNSEKLWGQMLNGVPITGLSELQEISKHTKVNLLIASTAYDAIKTQLINLNAINENLSIVN